MKIISVSLLLLFSLNLLAGEEKPFCKEYRERFVPPSAVGPAEAITAHSPQGMAFDDSPRERARLFPMKRIDFPTTCAADAQVFIEQAIYLLHGFFWYEAERFFREVQFRDPDCAIAYWGMAMASNGDIFSNVAAPRAKEFIARAVEKISEARGRALTSSQSRIRERERAYVEAFAAAYAGENPNNLSSRKASLAQWENLVEKFPEDMEAKAFLAFAYLKNSDVLGTSWDSSGDDVRALLVRAGPLVEAVLDAEPLHPVHHHRIHLWNYRNEPLAVSSAELSGLSAAFIPHLWHMPSHTYFGLGRIDPDAFRRAAYYQKAALRGYNAYLAGARLPSWMVGDYTHNLNWLLETLKRTGEAGSALSLARHWRDQPFDFERPWSTYSPHVIARSRTIELLDAFELWDTAVLWDQQGYLGEGDTLLQEVARLRLFAAAASYAKPNRETPSPLEKIECLADISPPDIRLTLAVLEIDTYQKIRAGDLAGARKNLKSMELRLEGKPHYYDSQNSLTRTRLADLWEAAGNKVRGIEWHRSAVDQNPGEVLALIHLAQSLRGDPKLAEERERTIAQLDLACASSDTTFPALARLRAERPDLCRPRPVWPEKSHAELDTFGPEFLPLEVAPDISNISKLVKSKPLLLFFSLGQSCIRCSEQLGDIDKLAKSLPEVTTVVVTGGEKGIGDVTKSGVSFLHANDPDWQMFRRFRVIDEFESPPLPLHGVFLVEGGRVLMKKVSAQPVREMKVLAAEVRRQRIVQGVK